VSCRVGRGSSAMAKSRSASGLAELPHLATFVRAAEQGSFTAAAFDLGVTQAAVSQRIAVLEKELRVSLFNRRAGKISVTEAGQRLYDLARQILDLHVQARKNLSGYHPSISGDLEIAASSVPGECFLSALLSGFHEKHPQVHVRATVSDSGTVMADVEKGRATLGLVGQKAERPNLESRPMGRDSLVLVVSPGHAWVTRKSISLQAMSSKPLIIREQGSGSRHALEKSLERAGTSLANLDTAFELGSNAAIKDAVIRGLGVAFLSRLAVKRELESKELRPVAVRGLCLTRNFYVVYHRRRPLSPAATVFLHFLQSHPIGQRTAKGS
jgi:LysR family transcriptional regulator, low CO2-responsive transcriptional regulator